MHGLLRVRGFTQDDAHIFCTPEQIEKEIADCVEFARDVLKDFGFDKFQTELSTWDPNDRKSFVGSEDQWNMATTSLEKVLKTAEHRVQDDSGRSGVLWPQDRHQAGRCHRTSVAALDRAVRLQPAAALRSRIRRRRRYPQAAVNGPPRALWIDRALLSASSSNTTPERSPYGSLPYR